MLNNYIEIDKDWRKELQDFLLTFAGGKDDQS